MPCLPLTVQTSVYDPLSVTASGLAGSTDMSGTAALGKGPLPTPEKVSGLAALSSRRLSRPRPGYLPNGFVMKWMGAVHWNGIAKVDLNLAQVANIGHRAEAHRVPRCLGPGGPANPVHITVRGFGQIVIHNKGNAPYINAPRRHIRGDQYRYLARSKSI